MLTILIGILTIAGVFKIRKMLCRQRDLWVKGSPRESLPMVMRRFDNQVVDASVEKDVSEYLYPNER